MKTSVSEQQAPTLWSKKGRGEMWFGNSLDKMRRMRSGTVDLCFTSPPFPLHRKKGYGNRDEGEYIDWLVPFLTEAIRILKPAGSLVIDLGCCWEKGSPVRSTYDLRLSLKLIDEFDLKLAQEFYWYNPSRLPSPAQWVNITKERAKDSVNKILWFSKSSNPKASNTRVLQPYSASMQQKFEAGITGDSRRPSGHKPSDKIYANRNEGSIPGNLLVCANNLSGAADGYLKYCEDHGLTPHPARFPYQIPEFFIRFLTEPGDKVLDPFAGSCTTGLAAEKNKRRWMCIEQNLEYLETAYGHFENQKSPKATRPMTLPRLGIYAGN